MKSSFSTAWISSTQVRKQRKYRHNAPLHLRHKFLSAHLSKALRQKYGKRNLPLRKGDEVLVMRGQFRAKKVKVISIYTARSKVTLEGLQRTKRDGSKISVYFDPRVLQIESLVLEDKQRIAAITRKASTAEKPTVKAPEKKQSPKSGEKNASNKTANAK